MRGTTKQAVNGKIAKAELPERRRTLLGRIRRRREQIRRRVGTLPNSAALIRQDRER
jgi:hypothetical protein